MCGRRANLRVARDAGFTLVETLVSLVMLSLCLAVLVDAFGGGFRGIRSSRLDAAALHLAKRQLALAGSESPLSQGRLQGTTPDGLEWSVVVEAYQASPAGPALAIPDGAGPKAYWVTAVVRWNRSAMPPPRSVSLTTLKLGNP